jgi:hypothetical protein
MMNVTNEQIINLVFTLGATFFGVFFAFLLDKRLKDMEKKGRDKENNDVLINSLELIIASIDDNKKQIISLENSINNGALKISCQIDYFSWETHSIVLNQFLSNLGLKNNIAKYYLKMNYLLKMFELYYGYFDEYNRFVFSSEDPVKKKEYFKNNIKSPEDINTEPDYVFYMLKNVIVGGNFHDWLPELRDLSIVILKEIECEIRVLKMKKF